MEAFCYLYHKLSTFSFVHSKEQKGTVVIYHDTLKMECCTSFITKTSLRVVTKVGLSMLRQVLGVGVGLGLTKKKTKKKSYSSLYSGQLLGIS